MTKLKALLTAAALLVAAGTAIPLALNQAGADLGVTPQQWCEKAQQANDIQKRERFFVGVADGATIPRESGGRLLGICGSGLCTIIPGVAEHCPITYDYDCGPLVNGWRICEVWAHPYFAKGWRNEASSNPDFRWYRSLGQVVTDCLAHFTGTQCLQLLQADDKCWLLDTGGVCRFGSLLGSGDETGPDPCPYARVQARMPCTVWRGAGSEMTDAVREFEAEEFDAL